MPAPTAANIYGKASTDLCRLRAVAYPAFGPSSHVTKAATQISPVYGGLAVGSGPRRTKENKSPLLYVDP